MVFLIAKDANEAEDFIKSKGLDKKSTRHVFSSLSLKGRPLGLMYCKLGEWFKRDDIDDIVSILNEKKAVEINIP